MKRKIEMAIAKHNGRKNFIRGIKVWQALMVKHSYPHML